MRRSCVVYVPNEHACVLMLDQPASKERNMLVTSRMLYQRLVLAWNSVGEVVVLPEGRMWKKKNRIGVTAYAPVD